MKRLIQVLLILVMGILFQSQISLSEVNSAPEQQPLEIKTSQLDAPWQVGSVDNGGWLIECVYCPKSFGELSNHSLQLRGEKLSKAISYSLYVIEQKFAFRCSQ